MRQRGKSLSHGGTSQEQNLTVQINLESLHCRERVREWRDRAKKNREKEEIKRNCEKERRGNEQKGAQVTVRKVKDEVSQ